MEIILIKILKAYNLLITNNLLTFRYIDLFINLLINLLFFFIALFNDFNLI